MATVTGQIVTDLAIVNLIIGIIESINLEVTIIEMIIHIEMSQIDITKITIIHDITVQEMAIIKIL